MKRLAFILVVAWAVLPSCSSMLDTVDENQVEQHLHHYNFNDADNAILGIYGKLMALVERVIVLGELRADLMESVDGNATFDQVDISNHAAAVSNKYCDVAPFYEVILNCNDALVNFDKMRAEKKLSTEEWSHRYSDVMAVRCWVYLQLGIHFGEIPYVTDPLLTIDDLDDESKFRRKSFDALLTELVQCMESIPVKSLSILSPLYTSNSVDGNLMHLVLLNKNFVRGDIHLWSGNYRQAAECYHDAITDASLNVGNEEWMYKVAGYVWDGSNEPRFQVTYARYRGTDLAAYRNKWKEIFSRPQNNAELSQECINVLQYDPRFKPSYPLIELFAGTGQGKYRLKPTQWAIDSLWEVQVQRENDFRFDGRGRQASFDYDLNGKPIVIKYLYDYYYQTAEINRTIELHYDVIPDLYKQQGRWFIYRAGLLHLRYAEAVNRAGYPDLAYAIINNGISGAYDWPRTNGNRRTDKEGVQYSGYPPADLDDEDVHSVPYPSPFYLDARFNSAPFEYYRSPWRENAGVRGRAFLRSIPIDTLAAGGWFTPAQIPLTDEHHPAIRWFEEHILTEAALECAFEGHRWGDMLRIALRKNGDGENGIDFLNQTLQKAKPGVTVTPDKLYLPIGKK